MKELEEIMQYGASTRQHILATFAEDYYRELGIEVPSDLWHSQAMTDLLETTSKSGAIRALRKIKKMACEYHKETVARYRIDGIPKATVFKVIKKTEIGKKIDELGVEGSTTENLHKGFITGPALKLIIDQFQKGKSGGLCREWPKESTRKFIAENLQKVLKNDENRV